LIVNTGTSQRSNARLYEVLPMISDKSVTISATPDKTTITVTGQRLVGKDVNVRYGKLLISKGQNATATQVVVETNRILPTDLPASVMVDGRESNTLPPRLETIDPPKAFAGDDVTLAGSGLSGQSVSVVFGATIVNIGPQAYASQLTVRVPPTLAAGAVAVKVTVNGKETNVLSLLILG
jgi:hypothetical protein